MSVAYTVGVVRVDIGPEWYGSSLHELIILQLLGRILTQTVAGSEMMAKSMVGVVDIRQCKEKDGKSVAMCMAPGLRPLPIIASGDFTSSKSIPD